MQQIPWWERLGVPQSLTAQKCTVERRVLVISYNAFLRRVVSEFLAQAGAIAIETRSSAEHALQYPVVELDLVLAEQDLPGESGLALLKQIRTGATGFASDVPFVLLVEAAARWMIDSALTLDADGCVLLPINAQKIDEAMRLALARVRQLPTPGQYEQVGTEPPRIAAAPELPAAPALPGCFARAMTGAGLVAVERLVPGMTLGADLLSERGVVLLLAGLVLDATAVGRLRNAADAFGFDSVPVIRAASEQGA